MTDANLKDLLERVGASLNEIEERLHNLPAKAVERGNAATKTPLGREYDLGSRYAKQAGVFEGGVIGAEFDVRRAKERLAEIIEEAFPAEMSETASAIGELCRPANAQVHPVFRDVLNSWRSAKGV